MGAMIMEEDSKVPRSSSRQGQSRGQSRNVSEPGSARNPNAILMSTNEALMLQPQSLQGVGAAIMTPGIDPSDKYRFPLTQNNTYGWSARAPLEFFGVSQYGRKASQWTT
jgi:hypothetical protein